MTVLGFSATFGTPYHPISPIFATKNDKMRLTALLRHTADTYPGHSASLHCIVDKAEELARKRYSVSRMIREMESFAHDADVLRLIVGTFKSVPVQPTLKMRDYKALHGSCGMLA